MAKRPNRGRPTKLNAKRLKQIVEDVKIGVTWECAAARVGICSKTLRKWRIKGERETSGLFFRLFQSLQEAESEFERSLVLKIRTSDDWRAAAWLLERRCNKSYGAEMKLRHSGGELIDQPIRVQAEILPPPPDSNAAYLLALERAGQIKVLDAAKPASPQP